MTRIKLEYFAQLRERTGFREEARETSAKTAEELYDELCGVYGFGLPSDKMRVAVNQVFCPWNQVLGDNDHVVFIPPVTGG